MPRNACVIQITPVRLTRTSANDASVVRKMYLSIDPIGYRTIRPATCRHDKGPTNPQMSRGSPWLSPHVSTGLFSHYHPFDPSTKWLRRGAPRLWLIFP